MHPDSIGSSPQSSTGGPKCFACSSEGKPPPPPQTNTSKNDPFQDDICFQSIETDRKKKFWVSEDHKRISRNKRRRLFLNQNRFQETTNRSKNSLGGKEEKITASPSSLSPQTTTTTKNQNQEQTESLPNPINQEQKQKKKKIKNASLPTLAKNASGGEEVLGGV